MQRKSVPPMVAVLIALVIVCSTQTFAQITTSTGASVLVFPKIVADETWDTTIQLSNGANRPAAARCHYVNGALTTPGLPAGPLNPPLWAQVDFVVYLVPQHATHWNVSRGRAVDPSDEGCIPTNLNCDGAGLDPGSVPPVPPGFTGELLCVELDASGAPSSGNALNGLATLTHRQTGEIMKYPAVGLAGLQTNNADETLCIGGTPGEACVVGAEYRGCPDSWIVSHATDYDERPVDGLASSSSLTVVPCSHNFETQTPQSVTLQVTVTNEFEQSFSASTSITCWADFKLTDVNPSFDRTTLGTDWAQSRVRAAAGSPSGFLLIQQTIRDGGNPPLFTAVATAPHSDGARETGDLIVIPQGEIQ